MRVVSLLPAATEICYAVGVEPVAVSHECDVPAAAQSLPSVNRSRVDNAGSSSEINDQVATAEAGDGVYEIDDEALRSADPDLVITQDVCDVCAIDASLARAAVDSVGADAEVVSLHSHTLSGVLEDIETVGAWTGREDEAAAVVDGLRERIDTVRRRARDLDQHPRVVVLDWMDPVMVAGHWVPELVETAGGRYGLAEAGERSMVREWARILKYDPEVLVAAPCGFELARTVKHATELTSRDGWDDLAAVRAGRAYAMDGHHYMNRPGPRLVDTLEHLAGVIHPRQFDSPPSDAVSRIVARRTAEG